MRYSLSGGEVRVSSCSAASIVRRPRSASLQLIKSSGAISSSLGESLSTRLRLAAAFTCLCPGVSGAVGPWWRHYPGVVTLSEFPLWCAMVPE